MNRWSRRLFCIGTVFIALAAAALISQTLILPPLLRRAILGWLAQSGFPAAQLRCRSLSWRSAELSDFELDQSGTLTVPALTLRYSPASLIRRKLKRIDVNGAQLTLRPGSRKFDIRRIASRFPTEDVELPFELLQLRSSALLIDWGEKPIRIPLEASLLNQGRGQGRLDLRADFCGAPLSFSATLPRAQKPLTFQLETRNLNLSSFAAALPRPFSNLPLHPNGRLALQLDGEASQSRARATINLTADGLTLETSYATLQDLNARLHVSLDADPARLRIAALPGSSFTFASAAASGLRINNTKVELTAADEPLAEFLFGRHPPKAHLACQAASNQEILIAGRNTVTTASNARISMAADLSPPKLAAAATLETDSLRLNFPSPAYSLDLERPVLGVHFNREPSTEPDFEATLNLHELSLRDEKSELLLQLDRQVLQPVSASFSPADRKGRLHFKWPLVGHAPLAAEAQIDLAGDRPAARFSVKSDRLHLDPQHPIAKKLANLTSLNLTGDFSLNADFRLDGGRLLPRLTIAPIDASLSGDRYNVTAQGVSGSVTFTGFSPLSTPPNQRLKIRAAELGNLILRDGSVSFTLEDNPPATFIERANWGWAGGRIHTDPFRINPKDPKISLRIFADGIKLRELLPLIFGEGATGEGTLRGMLPLVITGPGFSDISFGPAFLHASSAGGWWKLTGAPGKTLENVLDNALSPPQMPPEQAAKLEKVSMGLLDFQYTAFKIDIVEGQDGLLARLTTSGRSLDSTNPVEYEKLVFDFPGFETVLRKAILLHAGPGIVADRAFAPLNE